MGGGMKGRSKEDGRRKGGRMNVDGRPTCILGSETVERTPPCSCRLSVNTMDTGRFGDSGGVDFLRSLRN